MDQAKLPPLHPISSTKLVDSKLFQFIFISIIYESSYRGRWHLSSKVLTQSHPEAVREIEGRRERLERIISLCFSYFLWVAHALQFIHHHHYYGTSRRLPFNFTNLMQHTNEALVVSLSLFFSHTQTNDSFVPFSHAPFFRFGSMYENRQN